ncbi:hypothetical protein BB559_004034 [Furculomyces boomerangus]|uniref:NADH dehydrogenase [ubiquinone] 1 alpha subcomplex subunit 1 n=2 Tax=Harpellales TaxID=61421 RepID=A0A2T9YH80_9FUNG|nr:hypothetical protein BB559_004034 [Furculomyces boomerangus]PWA00600.1 hypothetical protein BB558_003347 [Smittium angustum]
MPLPFEPIIPIAIITAMFGIANLGYHIAHHQRNDGKPPRYNLDNWDRALMDRDLRLTGSLRGQNDNEVAPDEFKVNSFYRIYKRVY